ncbi:MAG TPA: zinc-binding alcohol dehydrogenase family protein [Agriterribacter sp.]|nr:zinc-binding alcohol dehydrogenase family protein [Agriterribacter sp.]
MMKAIGFKTSLPITHKESFIEFETDIQKPTGYDILVKIKAAAVNPVDYKVRQASAKDKVLAQPKIIGWDAVGTVETIGEHVTLFKRGDEVFYAGDINRAGSYAEYQLVDERIVGNQPKNISVAESAAMPLTGLTAWELLFDRMRITKSRDKGKSILFIGGAGGVGSIAIQLAKKIAGLTVIATASRPETKAWCLKQGADYVVNHHNLINEVRTAGFETVDFIADFVNTNSYWDAMVELVKPQGHIASITGSSEPIALNKFKTKSASFSWEFMFTRSHFQTGDMIEQHHILNRLANLLDDGTIHTTVTTIFNGLSADNFKDAHALQESGKAIGKTVILF